MYKSGCSEHNRGNGKYAYKQCYKKEQLENEKERTKGGKCQQ